MVLAVLSAAALAVAAPLWGAAPQEELSARVDAAWRAGRYAEALTLAYGAREPAEAARLEATVRWAAGDLDGALAGAREGLVAAPDDLALAALAADLALALGLAEEGRRQLDRLSAGLDRDPAAAALWAPRRAGLEALAEEAEAALAARDRALGRARVVGGGLVALVVAALLGGLLWGTRARAPRP